MVEKTLAAAQVLVAVKPPDLARLGRLREVQGRLEDAAETFGVADMPADALRNWRAAGKWQQAVRLAEGQERSDLEWLVEFDTLVRRRPAGQRKRLTAQRARVPRAACWTPSSASPEAAEPPSLRRCRSSSCRRSAPACRPGSSRPTAYRRSRRRRRNGPVLRPAGDGVPETGRSLPTPGGA